MPVVINEFEVTPQPPMPDNQAPANNVAEKGGKKSEMTDHEIEKMLERRMERAERIAAH